MSIEISCAENKARSVLMNAGNVMVSVSGGADSDCMIDLLYRINAELSEKNVGANIFFVFFDTGLEYKATKEHLNYLEQRYNIKIDRVKAYKSIPYAIKKYGVPFWSKRVSESIERLQKHNFDFKNAKGKRWESLWEQYPNSKAAIRWLCSDFPHPATNASYVHGLYDYLCDNPPQFAISAKCCEYAKKKTSKQYAKEHNIDMICTGIRRAEGGTRATAYKSCFDRDDEIANFRPLFWLSNNDRIEYENKYGIIHSICYTKYGLKRTGCVGCPFARNFEEEIAIIKKYEPELYIACMNIFEKSYNYRREFLNYRKLLTFI